MFQEIMDQMKNIKYGWKDRYGKIHCCIDETFSDDYVLETPDEVLDNNIGVCWDQVELERYFFEKINVEFNTYFIVHYDNDKCPTHTFLIYKNNNSYFWFEHSWERFRGIHIYKTEEDALKDIKNKFINYDLNNEYDDSKLYIYKYKKPNFGINCSQFYDHCEHGESIII